MPGGAQFHAHVRLPLRGVRQSVRCPRLVRREAGRAGARLSLLPEHAGEAGHHGRTAGSQRAEVADGLRLRTEWRLGVLPIVTPVRVSIVGAPVSCGDEVTDTWRELAAWAAAQLRHRYGDAVALEYHDLFDPDCPPVPEDVQLPLVLVDGRVLSSGGKLSMPLIRRAVEAAGVASHVSALPSP